VRPRISSVVAAYCGRLNELLAGDAHADNKMLFGCTSLVLGMLGQSWDDVVANRVKEIELWRDIFLRCIDSVPSQISNALRRSLDMTADIREDLRVSTLDYKLEVMRSALVELHEWLESEEATEHRVLTDEILSGLELTSRLRLIPDIGWF